MNDPFKERSYSLSGPATDIRPVTPSDSADLPSVAIALYVESAGTVAFVTQAGESRLVNLPDFSFLPVGTRQVLASGTTASGIHALTVV